MSYETNDKMVSHPDHYKSGKYEVIDIIDEFCKDLTGTEAVCTANAIKYILRWKKKNGVQDLKKAVWYLTHLIETFTNEGLEDHAKFDELRQEKLENNDDAYHMEDNTSGGIKLNEWEKASLAAQGFKRIIIHHVDGRPKEIIDISDLAPEPKKSIDDEPEPLNLRKNAAGVYIPEEKHCSNCGHYTKETYQCDAIESCVNHSEWTSEKNDFMNPPYEELKKQCEEYYKANERLKERFDDAVANINLLEGDKESILEDYKTTLKTISNRLSAGSPYSKKELREWVDKKLEDIKNGRKDDSES